MERTIRVEQRYLDRSRTRTMPQYYNVYINGVYCGYVCPNSAPPARVVEGDWLWCVPDVTIYDRADHGDVIAAATDYDRRMACQGAA